MRDYMEIWKRLHILDSIPPEAYPGAIIKGKYLMWGETPVVVGK